MIPAGTNDVDDHRQAVLDVEAALAHRTSRSYNLVNALALGGERDQQARGLCGRVLAVHYPANERCGLFLREILSGEQTPQERGELAHDAVGVRDDAKERKFSMRRSPCSLSTDSGWN